MLSRRIARTFAVKGKEIKVPLSKIDVHLLPDYKPPTHATITSDELMEAYRKMYTIRRMEQCFDELYKAQKIKGFCHLYDGQESVGVGIEMVLDNEDCVIQSYRHHAASFLRGVPVYNIICELIMKRDGWAKGKGGSMHIYDGKTHYYGGNGIVGAQCSLGAGFAFALKYEGKKKNVSVAFYGDGASNQGQLFEAANMASLWKLPLIYVCENNGIAMGTQVMRGSAGGPERAGEFHKKLYNIPGLKVNGHNLVEMREIAKFAKDYATKNGPIVLNVITYRYHGHSMSDPGNTYRTREDIAFQRKNTDCVKFVENLLISNKIYTEKELEEVQAGIQAGIDRDRERAFACEGIDVKEHLTDVYTPDFKHFMRAINYEDSIFIKEKLIE